MTNVYGVKRQPCLQAVEFLQHFEVTSHKCTSAYTPLPTLKDFEVERKSDAKCF